MARGLEPLCCAAGLGALGLFSPEKGRLLESLEHLPAPRGAGEEAGEGLFPRACSARTRGNGFALREGRWRSELREKSFPVRAARRRHGLPRAAVGAPALAMPKARLDGAGSHRGWGKGALCVAGVGLGGL